MPEVASFADALRLAGSRPPVTAAAPEKKNYAERLSRQLATLFAMRLRSTFKGILPHDDGRQQESRARTSRGVKKLDVNYSTPELGLGLGLSLKTINYRDAKTKRYTKNYTRVDNELRAEAMDYHVRQPFSVLVAVLFLPADACADGKPAKKNVAGTASSFGAAVASMRDRGGRTTARDDAELFEGFFIGLYDHEGPHTGRVEFFDVRESPPSRGRPPAMLTIDQLIERIVGIYDARNNPRMQWADVPPLATPPELGVPPIPEDTDDLVDDE